MREPEILDRIDGPRGPELIVRIPDEGPGALPEAFSTGLWRWQKDRMVERGPRWLNALFRRLIGEPYDYAYLYRPAPDEAT